MIVWSYVYLVMFGHIHFFHTHSFVIMLLRNIYIIIRDNIYILAGTPPDWRYSQINSIIIDLRV